MDKTFEFLIVDDDEIFIYLLKSVLEKSGYARSIHIFASTPEALQWIHAQVDKGERLPELMIVDIRMPIMNGIELLEKISKLPPKSLEGVGVSMLTSSLSESDKKASLAYPFVFDFVSKPFTREKLRDMVEKYVALEKA
ncbi:MAG: hypothetical protein RL090_1826 [Bacteroidota bacterium]|jgi:CheY-like chemotaxis protein